MQDDKSKHVRSDQDEPAREGDVLGLGGSVVPKSSTDPTTEFDEASEARRRARIRDESADEGSTGTAFRRSSGATGIDMGAGGSGTDVE
jgi:hypothetical protein